MVYLLQRISEVRLAFHGVKKWTIHALTDQALDIDFKKVKRLAAFQTLVNLWRQTFLCYLDNIWRFAPTGQNVDFNGLVGRRQVATIEGGGAC